MDLASKTITFDHLSPVQDGGAVNWFYVNLEKGAVPCYTEGYLTFSEGGTIKIPGAMHRSGFDQTPESYDIVTQVTDELQDATQVCAMLTTNDTKVESGCSGEITIYYKIKN